MELPSVIDILCQQNYLHPKTHLLALQQTSVLLNQITWENIYAVRFSGVDVPETTIISCLSKAIALRSASFSFCNSVGFETLGFLKKRATSLLELDLYGCEQLTDDGVKILKGLTNLRKLKLGGCSQLTANGISSIEGFLSLEELNLDGCNIQDGWLLSFAHITTLRQLLLFGNRLTGEGFKHLSHLDNLKTLYLDGSHNLTDPDFDCLSALTNLTELNLDSCKVTNISLKALESLRKLSLLSLNACELSDAGLIHIQNLTNIQVLDLGAVQRVTDTTIESIHKLTRLEYLVLDGCHQLTDNSLNFISSHPKLQFLSIDDCTLFTDEGLLGLSSLVDLTSLSTWGCSTLTHVHYDKLTNLKKNTIPSFFSYDPPTQEPVAQTGWEGEPIEATDYDGDDEMPPLVGGDDEPPPLISGYIDDWDKKTPTREPGCEDEQGGWSGREAGWERKEYDEHTSWEAGQSGLSGSGAWENTGDDNTSGSYSYRVVPSDTKSPQRNHDHDDPWATGGGGYTQDLQNGAGQSSWDTQFDDDMEMAMKLSLLDQESPTPASGSISASSEGWEVDHSVNDLTQAVPIEAKPLETTTNSPWQVQEPEDDDMDLQAALALSVSAEFNPNQEPTNSLPLADDWNAPRTDLHSAPNLPAADNWTRTHPKVEEWQPADDVMPPLEADPWDEPPTNNSVRNELDYWSEQSKKKQQEIDDWNKPRTDDWADLQKKTYGSGWTNTVNDDEDEDFKRAMALSVGEDPTTTTKVPNDNGASETPNETKTEGTESVYQQTEQQDQKITYCVQENALKGWRKLGAWLEKKREWEDWKRNNPN